MGGSYRQFCPVSKAMELLDERWTVLVVRELLAGSERFSDLARGVPRMSPTLLSKRLAQLDRSGIVERQVRGREIRYVLTAAGRELRPVVEALGVWGTRWIGEVGDRDLDPKLLLWDMHRNVDHVVVGARRRVVAVHFTDVPASVGWWWLVIDPTEVDVCDVDPGRPVDVTVTVPLRSAVAYWRGDREWAELLRSGDLVLDGAPAVRRSLPRWFNRSAFAAVERVPEQVGAVADSGAERGTGCDATG